MSDRWNPRVPRIGPCNMELRRIGAALGSCLPRKNPQRFCAAPRAACWSGPRTRNSLSAPIAAARLTSENGRWASTRSVLPFSTPRCLRIWENSGAATMRAPEMSNGAAQTATPTAPKTFWAWTVATFFGAGLGKPGPGTWGSAAAVLLWAAVAWGLHPSPRALLLILCCGIALSLLFGVPAASIVAHESGKKDPGFVVIDEVAGQWITLLLCPVDWRSAAIA